MSAWHDLIARYRVGDTLQARVVKPVPFGALIEVGDGVPGLLVGDAPRQPGGTVPVRITQLDQAKQRVAATAA